jgi:hypothetical protein
MITTLKFSKDSKWREFEGKQYLNCDDYTEEEMAVVANWDDATKEKRSAFCDKYGFNSTPGLYTSYVPLNLYVRVRLADVNRTVEWRAVEASNLDEAIKVAERMPDVEVALEATVDSSEYDRMTGDITARGGLGDIPEPEGDT